LAPVAGLAAVVLALTLVPMGGVQALLAFPGDLVLLVYLLGTVRFLTVMGALDTGSSFEGMGASREVHFAALAEPVLMLTLVALARRTGSISLSEIYAAINFGAWIQAGPALGMAAAALLGVLLAENARIPVDDPNTHLELTMIHEVMVLDYSGPDLAMIQYTAGLKLWVFGALLVGLCVPLRTGWLVPDVCAFLLGMLALAVMIGVIESSMARLRLLRVPQMLVGAGAIAMVALVLVAR
jgi:formate hydrogenlyase subunit 4